MTFSYLPQERIRMASKSCYLTRQQHMAGTDLLLKTTSSIIKKKTKHLNVIPKKLFITLLVWEESSRILLFFLWVELCSSFPIEANGHFCTCAKIINLLLCLTKGAY